MDKVESQRVAIVLEEILGAARRLGYVYDTSVDLRILERAIAALREQAGAVPCRACKGRGYTDEGDPEVGSALFDCDECSAASPSPPVEHEAPRADIMRAAEYAVPKLNNIANRIRSKSPNVAVEVEQIATLLVTGITGERHV